MISTAKIHHSIESARPKPMLQSLSFFDDQEVNEKKATPSTSASSLSDWENDGGNNFDQHVSNEHSSTVHKLKSKLQATRRKIMGYLKSKATH